MISKCFFKVLFFTQATIVFSYHETSIDTYKRHTQSVQKQQLRTMLNFFKKEKELIDAWCNMLKEKFDVFQAEKNLLEQTNLILKQKNDCLQKHLYKKKLLLKKTQVRNRKLSHSSFKLYTDKLTLQNQLVSIKNKIVSLVDPLWAIKKSTEKLIHAEKTKRLLLIECNLLNKKIATIKKEFAS